MTNYHFCAQTTLRGYHAYKNIVVTLGEILTCEAEPDNEFDKFAVVAKTDGENIVGYPPVEIAPKIHTVLKDGGEVEAEVIGCQFNKGARKGLEISTDIKCIGSYSYLKTLRKELAKILGKKMDAYSCFS